MCVDPGPRRTCQCEWWPRRWPCEPCGESRVTAPRLGLTVSRSLPQPTQCPQTPGALPSPLGPLHLPLPRLLVRAFPPDPLAPLGLLNPARQTWCPPASLLGQLHAHSCPPLILAQDGCHWRVSLLACSHVCHEGLSRPKALWPGGAAERGALSSPRAQYFQILRVPGPLLSCLGLGFRK